MSELLRSLIFELRELVCIRCSTLLVGCANCALLKSELLRSLIFELCELVCMRCSTLLKLLMTCVNNICFSSYDGTNVS